MATTHLITGGQRSGKSTYALKIAESLSCNPVYIATAKVWDDEFAERIARHKNERGEHWTNFEELLYVGNCEIDGRVVLFDCVTLWLTNIYFLNDQDVDKSLDWAKKEWDRLVLNNSTIIVVTNEIGLSPIPDNALTRRFVDLQGWMNQYIASKAENVTLMVSGIGVKIKQS